MTDYTKSTNFATKDSLPSGNPAKIVKGTEINTEFDNIATAVATKSNKASPTFTGTLTAADVSITGNTTLGNAATDTVTITADVASNVIPSADSTYTLRDGSNYWSHGYIDAVTTTGNVAIGGNLTVTGNAIISGNLTFGDADTDSITLTADVASHITPDVDDTYDLGTAAKEWRNIYVDGTAYVDNIDLNGTAITATGAELNTLDGITATTAELNTLDGITATVAELNTLDGITATVTELNYTDGVTSNIQTQLNAKQPLDAGLTSISGLTTAADKMIYTTALDTYAVTSLSSFGRSLVDDADAATARTTLGLVIGTNVQAYDAQLADVAGLTPTDGNFIVGNGTNFVAESGATARASLGLTIGTDVQAYDADTAKYDDVTANFTGTLQNAGSNVVVDSDVGSTVLAYDSNLQSFVTTFTLPTVDSTAGYVLKTDGAGTLSFVAQSAYDESTVNITGGSINGTTIGATTPSTGSFSSLNVGGSDVVVDTDIGVTVQAYDADTTKNDVANTFTAVQTFDNGITEEFTTVTSSSGAATIDLQAGTNFAITLSEATTFTFSNAPTGNATAFTLKVVQDASASGYSVTWPTLKWPSATAPTLTATASAIDYFVFLYDGSGWYGFTAGQALA